MVLEHYIGEFLYRYNCIVVPGFGAFLAQKTAARINQDTNTFFAPSKSIAFNGQLVSNDGLLVSYISESEKMSFEATLLAIEERVKWWNSTLRKDGSLTLRNIGLLTTTMEGKVLFQPAYEPNYLTSSFGLSNLNAMPVTREVLKEEVVAIEEKIPFVISPERRESKGIRPY